jgi:energy-coupling factor transporter ATP-binding protein EcfA2
VSLNARKPGESLADYAARLRAEKAQPAYDEDLIPEQDRQPRSADDDDISRLIDNDSIVDAYRRWCGKMEPNVGSKRESIMVSCPSPAHPDTDPSAWVNLDKNVGTCPLCGGFDQYDIFAWNRAGFNKDTYRTDGTFPAMRREMATDLGYIVRRTIAGTEYVEPVEPPQTAVEPSSPPPEPENDESNVRTFPGAVPEPTIYDDRPPIDWRNLLDSSSTFLYQWMEACSIDDLPEEFYFWLGLIALGSAVGNNVKLRDRYPVRSNLLLCLTGPTGMGKSRATSALTRLMHQAFPYNRSQLGGVKLVPMPGSAEALVDCFCEPLYDPVDPKVITGYHPVRGIVKIDELASLMTRAARTGNAVKPTLMELYDSDAKISLISRGHGTSEADGHFSQVISTTQPRAMRDMLSRADDDSGFLNRWVFATGVAKKPVSIGGDVIDITPLVDPIQDVRAWGSTQLFIPLNDAAFAMWDEFFHEKIVPLKMSEDASVYVRIDLLMKKLMLLLAIDKQETVVDVRTVEQAIQLWDYLVAGYMATAAAVNSSNEEDLCQGIEETIRRIFEATGRGATTRDFQRGMKKIWQQQGAQAVLKQLETMTKLGLLKEVSTASSGKGGRPTSRYLLADEVSFA